MVPFGLFVVLGADACVQDGVGGLSVAAGVALMRRRWGWAVCRETGLKASDGYETVAG